MLCFGKIIEIWHSRLPLKRGLAAAVFSVCFPIFPCVFLHSGVCLLPPAVPRGSSPSSSRGFVLRWLRVPGLLQVSVTQLPVPTLDSPPCLHFQHPSDRLFETMDLSPTIQTQLLPVTLSASSNFLLVKSPLCKINPADNLAYH